MSLWCAVRRQCYCRSTFVILGIDLNAPVDQQLDDRLVPPSGRGMHQRATRLIVPLGSRIKRSALFDEEPGYAGLSTCHRLEKRGATAVVRQVHRGAPGNEHLHNRHMPPAGCFVHGCVARWTPRIGVDAASEQTVYLPGIARTRRLVQRIRRPSPARTLLAPAHENRINARIRRRTPLSLTALLPPVCVLIPSRHRRQQGRIVVRPPIIRHAGRQRSRHQRIFFPDGRELG